MCGRFVLYNDRNRLAEHYGLTNIPTFTGDYNISPSAFVPVVRLDQERGSYLSLGVHPAPGQGTRTETHQCPRRDPHRKTVIPGCVQTAALPDTGRRLLRMAGRGRREAALFHTGEGHGGVFLCGPPVIMAGTGRHPGELRHHHHGGKRGTGLHPRQDAGHHRAEPLRDVA